MLKKFCNSIDYELRFKFSKTIFACFFIFLITPQFFAQTSKSKEALNLRQLSALLEKDSQVKVFATSILAEVRQSQILTVHMRPNGVASGNTFLLQQIANVDLSISKLRKSNSPIRRNRFFQFSSDHILILAVDQNKQVLWWDTQTDPRLLRAEIPDEAGNLQGQKYYRTEAQMIVAIPQDQRIVELRFYGSDSEASKTGLKLLGTSSINDENVNQGGKQLR